MIGRLQGIVLEKQPPHLLIDVRGVGYDLLAPMSTFYNLPAGNTEVVLYTHFAVSETSQQLFGFANREDRALFRQLIKVTGVGPRMAVGIMSGMDSDEFVQCVMNNDLASLVKVPGVGKKTAERLVVEMRDRLKDWQGGTAQPTAPKGAAPSGGGSNVMISEAEAALVALGYKPVEASKLVAGVLKHHEVTRSEELIRLSLRSMMPG